jgi:hypothetical protein
MHNELRKAIKAQYPDLKFKIRTIDFTDLARDSKVFVESEEWGMTVGNQITFRGVQEIAERYNAIVSW